MSNRHNLAIVRAGDGSLHTQWLNRSGEERNWDLIVSYWGDDPKAYRGGDWLRVDCKGLKFQAVDELIHTHGISPKVRLCVDGRRRSGLHLRGY